LNGVIVGDGGGATGIEFSMSSGMEKENRRPLVPMVGNSMVT
jgi:hypothetical protein